MAKFGDFHGKVVLVTGFAIGIGRATALAFASRGASLVLCDINEDGLATVTKEVQAACGDKPLALLGSVAADIPLQDVLSYCMSKAAVTKLRKYLSMELGPQGVRVNDVTPGFTNTTIFGTFWSEEEVQALLQAATSSFIPMGKLCEPEDVVRAIVHLPSNEDSPMTNGLSYAVAGGANVRGFTM